MTTTPVPNRILNRALVLLSPEVLKEGYVFRPPAKEASKPSRTIFFSPQKPVFRGGRFSIRGVTGWKADQFQALFGFIPDSGEVIFVGIPLVTQAPKITCQE